jgi:selenium-binding protein 1
MLYGVSLLRCAQALSAILATGLFVVAPAHGDETCNSPYISNLIKGQEDFIHVWTLGEKGLGDGSDKLVTIDVNPTSIS